MSSPYLKLEMEQFLHKAEITEWILFIAIHKILVAIHNVFKLYDLSKVFYKKETTGKFWYRQHGISIEIGIYIDIAIGIKNDKFYFCVAKFFMQNRIHINTLTMVIIIFWNF